MNMKEIFFGVRKYVRSIGVLTTVQYESIIAGIGTGFQL